MIEDEPCVRAAGSQLCRVPEFIRTYTDVETHIQAGEQAYTRNEIRLEAVPGSHSTMQPDTHSFKRRGLGFRRDRAEPINKAGLGRVCGNYGTQHRRVRFAAESDDILDFCLTLLLGCSDLHIDRAFDAESFCGACIIYRRMALGKRPVWRKPGQSKLRQVPQVLVRIEDFHVLIPSEGGFLRQLKFISVSTPPSPEVSGRMGLGIRARQSKSNCASGCSLYFSLFLLCGGVN